MGIASIVNKQTKKKDINEALVESIMTAIKIQNPPYQSTKANIKPSKIQCDRQMYYILTNGQANLVQTTDPKLILIQKMGSYIHLLIQEAMSKAEPQGIILRKPEDIVEAAIARGINTQIVPSKYDSNNPYEAHCYNSDYNISFMWDGGIYFKDSKTLIEIKSEDHFKSIQRIAPDPEHIEQSTCYSLGLGVDDVIFLYVNRNYLNIKSYLVHIDNMMKQEVLDKFARVNDAVSKGTLPEKIKCKSCKYCDYTVICKSNINSVEEVN